MKEVVKDREGEEEMKELKKKQGGEDKVRGGNRGRVWTETSENDRSKKGKNGNENGRGVRKIKGCGGGEKRRMGRKDGGETKEEERTWGEGGQMYSSSVGIHYLAKKSWSSLGND